MADFERLPADWLSFDEAIARILASASPMPATDAAPLSALGRSLARPVRARATLPAWPNSAMDGYAVRSEDLDRLGPAPEIRLPVAGRSYPGSPPLDSVAPGAAVRVMTGGPLPVGFDSVIRVEHTDGEEGAGVVVLRRLDDVGRHVRAAGKDMLAGEETLAAGTVVHSGTLPVIAASGCERVSVFRRPRVGIMSSGDELVGAASFERVIAGLGVPDSNRVMIAAAVAEAGGVAVDLGIAPDDPAGLEARLSSLGGIDLLVTTGGASMGERDLLKRILLRFPFRLDFWRARVRPGSPVSFGHLRRGGGGGAARLRPARQPGFRLRHLSRAGGALSSGRTGGGEAGGADGDSSHGRPPAVPGEAHPVLPGEPARRRGRRPDPLRPHRTPGQRAGAFPARRRRTRSRARGPGRHSAGRSRFGNGLWRQTMRAAAVVLCALAASACQTPQWPAEGPISAAFGVRAGGFVADLHRGVDLGVPSGTRVRPILSGRVRFAGTMEGYGNVVWVDHTDELLSVYAHLSEIHVESAQEVTKATVLGLSGQSGSATGPHLHLEVWRWGREVDPVQFLGRPGG